MRAPRTVPVELTGHLASWSLVPEMGRPEASGPLQRTGPAGGPGRVSERQVRLGLLRAILLRAREKHGPPHQQRESG